MANCTAKIDAALASIEAAAFDPEAWDDALRAIAVAAGGKFGELIFIDRSSGGAVSRLPDMDPGLIREWAEVDGHHPGVNSRVRIGAAAPVMEVLDETHFTTEGDMRRHPAYGDLIERADIPYICLTTLIRAPTLQVGLAVMRGRGQGNVEVQDRRTFELLADRSRQAARTNLLLAGQAAQGASLALEHIGRAAFICDASGRVLNMTREAESHLAEGRFLLNGGRVIESASGRDLSDLARAAAQGNRAALAPLVLSGGDEADDLILECLPFPGEVVGLPVGPGALILLRRPWAQAEDELGRRMCALYGLTPRETAVANGLCRGLSPQALSLKLGVGLGTMRTHIRRLFDKTGAGSLAHLVALLKAYDN